MDLLSLTAVCRHATLGSLYWLNIGPNLNTLINVGKNPVKISILPILLNPVRFCCKVPK